MASSASETTEGTGTDTPTSEQAPLFKDMSDQYTTTVTMTFKDGKTLQVHKFIHDQLRDAATSAMSPAHFGFSYMTGQIAVHYLYTGKVASLYPLPDFLTPSYPMGAVIASVKGTLIVLLELAAHMAPFEALKELATYAEETLDSLPWFNSPVAFLVALYESLSAIDYRDLDRQIWLCTLVNRVLGFLSYHGLWRVARFLATVPEVDGVPLSDQLFLRPIFVAMLICKSKGDNSEISLGELALAPPNADLEGPIAELSQRNKLAKQCLAEVAWKPLKTGGQGLVIAPADYEILKETNSFVEGVISAMRESAKKDGHEEPDAN